MKYYFAPMEGITGYIYRSAHHASFKPADKYFTPFIAPNKNKSLNTKELNDILPAHNDGVTVIPQILTNSAADFIRACHKLKANGYSEVNLNLGCPSGTVAAKGRGAGFLAMPKELDLFLEQVFTETPVEVSIKTRLGMAEPEEFKDLLEIYNKYPLSELIIHPRVRNDFYKNKPRRDVFREAFRLSKNPLCYNGDIFTPTDYKEFIAEFPGADTCMFGRGFVSNPAFLNCLDGSRPEKRQLKEFHDRVCREYQTLFSGDRNVLFKMKEIWHYMIHLFLDSEKPGKKIRKSQRLSEYFEVVEILFAEHETIIREHLKF